ncbi:MAG TPA: gas vesicle protein GvpG [Candidatus Limnocylindrales bacterium]|nr:gas vesicle protein GvpG [Candidatus Limnocylindrales bacterium]
MLLKLLGLPVTLPAAGIRFCLQKVADVAEHELYDVDHLNEELILLNLRLEDGEIDEAEHRAREAELLVLLRDAKEHRKAEADAAIAASPEGGRYVVEALGVTEEDEP